MSSRENCIYCGKKITTRSSEHVIHNALGGKMQIISYDFNLQNGLKCCGTHIKNTPPKWGSLINYIGGFDE